MYLESKAPVDFELSNIPNATCNICAFFFFNLNCIWQGVKLRKSKKREDPNSQIDWRTQELLALWMEAITWKNIAVGGLDWDIKTNRCPGHWS